MKPLHPFTAALVAAITLPLAAHAAEPAPWPVAPYFHYVHALATGQGELALAQFAPDAVVVAGPRCTAGSPCRGHAAIARGFLQPALAAGLRPPVEAQQFDGTWMRARGEALGPATWLFELRGGRIATLRVEPAAAVAAE